MTAEPCICGKTKPYTKCCGQFISGKAHAKTAEQLMRSRYCAYALGDHGKYLMATWLPATAIGLNAQELSKKTLDWQRLEVIKSSQKGDSATVEFKAWYKAPDSDEIEAMHEISEFARIKSHWFYIGGQVN